MTGRAPMQVSPLLTALREATAEMHKAVERQTPFFAPGFDRSAYEHWLDLMHPYYVVVDHAVQSSGFEATWDWPYVPRSGLIERDLQAIAARPPAPTKASPTVLAPLAALRSHGEIAGMLYVIEGSALGGHVLLKIFERAAGVTASHGASFFAPHGEDPRPRWGAFMRTLARISGDEQASREAVHGAITAFGTLGRWIDADSRGGD